MRSLQNLEHILGNFERLPISTAFVAAFFACLAVELCLQIGLGRDRQAPNQGTRSALSYLLRGLPYAVILMFALRADSLFYKGPDMPDMHWDYFIGPVQTVRSGGWLLWDTPSQYGFLNILLTALIPFRSAWDSFYFFSSCYTVCCCRAVLPLSSPLFARRTSNLARSCHNQLLPCLPYLDRPSTIPLLQRGSLPLVLRAAVFFSVDFFEARPVNAHVRATGNVPLVSCCAVVGGKRDLRNANFFRSRPLVFPVALSVRRPLNFDRAGELESRNLSARDTRVDSPWNIDNLLLGDWARSRLRNVLDVWLRVCSWLWRHSYELGRTHLDFRPRISCGQRGSQSSPD
jgi:hypothetical protein